MKNIIIAGPSRAGKTTLANRNKHFFHFKSKLLFIIRSLCMNNIS